MISIKLILTVHTYNFDLFYDEYLLKLSLIIS